MDAMLSSTITATTFLLLFFVHTSEAVMFTPERGSILNITLVKASSCKVCTGAGRSRKCTKGVQFKDSVPVTLEFGCSRPQDVYVVEISRSIACSTQTCTDHIRTNLAVSHTFQAFNRKFTWNLKATFPKSVQVSLGSRGVRQISPRTTCPDKHSFTLEAVERTGEVMIGKYCVEGSIQSAHILEEGRLTLDLPAGEVLRHPQFDVSVGEEIKSLAKVKLSLPDGTSSSELFSPNYPDSFPDDDIMEWDFKVSDKLRVQVEFQDLVQPLCLKKTTDMEYQSRGRGVQVLKLSDPPPVQNQGDFSLKLRNCEMNRSGARSQGLSFKMKVSGSTVTGPAVFCSVDMKKTRGFSLHVHKLNPRSACVMTLDSVLKENVTVPSDAVARLSFQDCRPEDLRVTCSRVLGCDQVKNCPMVPVLPMVPFFPACLPSPLSAVTWTLRPPQHGTVELTSSTAPLRQSLPGQLCNDTLVDVAEEAGDTVGRFCPQGSIQKIQINSNVSVTLSTAGGSLKLSTKPLFIVTMKGDISDRYIFTVSPKRNTTVSVATPGWPGGMRSYAGVSWIVSVPVNMEAHVLFAAVRQPKCGNRHTNIRLQRVGRPEEDYSRREDEEAEDQIRVSGSFFLNMSNCMPEVREFSVLSRITLQRSKNNTLTIVLSLVAALVVVATVVLIVVCVVIRKKKKLLSPQVSVYNANGTSFLPGQNQTPKSPEDEYHVYDSIEDSLVYTHLLRKGAEMGVYGDVDAYESCDGHKDSVKPPVSKVQDEGEYEEFHGKDQKGPPGPPLPNRPRGHTQPMVDNELYESSEVEAGGSDGIGPRLEPEGGH